MQGGLGHTTLLGSLLHTHRASCHCFVCLLLFTELYPQWVGSRCVVIGTFTGALLWDLTTREWSDNVWPATRKGKEPAISTDRVMCVKGLIVIVITLGALWSTGSTRLSMWCFSLWGGSSALTLLAWWFRMSYSLCITITVRCREKLFSAGKGRPHISLWSGTLPLLPVWAFFFPLVTDHACWMSTVNKNGSSAGENWTLLSSSFSTRSGPKNIKKTWTCSAIILVPLHPYKWF